MKLAVSKTTLIDTLRLIAAGAIGGLVTHYSSTFTSSPASPSVSTSGKDRTVRLRDFKAKTADGIQIGFNMRVDIKEERAGNAKDDALLKAFSSCATSVIGKSVLEKVGAKEVLMESSRRLILNPTKDTVEINFFSSSETRKEIEDCLSAKFPSKANPGTIIASDTGPIYVWTSEMRATIPVHKP